MSNTSTNEANWSGRLIRARVDLPEARADDPRLGQFIQPWTGDLASITPSRPVLVGFPTDEGVRRNAGRPGSALAPAAIRHWLYRLTPHDGATDADLTRLPPLDLGDVAVGPDLEADQQTLGHIVAAILERRAVPIVLGGGHETAFGHFLGYARLGEPIGVINLDAHLDVRPLINEQGHSGSPFRQMIEHPSKVLNGDNYVCLGAQPFSTGREHTRWMTGQGGRIAWCEEVRGGLPARFERERERMERANLGVYLSVDADVCSSADVPGVSAPNPLGLSGVEVADTVKNAGLSSFIRSLDVVEINPLLDADERSCRWGALVIWQFLSGLARRNGF